MPQRTATIESLPMAFALVKEMQGDGLEWGEDYRLLARKALAEIIEGRMRECRFATQHRSSGIAPPQRQESGGAFGGTRSRARSGSRRGPIPNPEHAMRTSETLLLDFIRQSPQVRMPVNQRRYSWTKRECAQVWKKL